MLVFEKHVIFCGDTTVNIDPTAEQLAQIAISASGLVTNFGQVPKVAMLSFSNFGSVKHPQAQKMADAVKILRELRPQLIVDGEMQADTAFSEEILASRYPFSRLKEAANVLIFPEPERGQHRVQVAHANWAGPPRSAPSSSAWRIRCTCSSRAPTCRRS